MIKPMQNAYLIWHNPQEMLDEWEHSADKHLQEKTVAEFVGHCGKLVDLGCGDGRLAATLDYDSYQGYDGSHLMLVAAKQRNPELSFALIDIFRFQSDEIYDTVLLLDVAIHQMDPLAAIDIILRNWKAKRYIISILVGSVHEELLNSVVISYDELQSFLVNQHNANKILSESIKGEKFTWNLIEFIKEI